VALPVVTLPRQHRSQGLGSSQAVASRQSRAVIFNDSAVALESVPKLDAPPSSKRVVHIQLSIKRLKDLQQDINFRWVQYDCRVVCNEVID